MKILNIITAVLILCSVASCEKSGKEDQEIYDEFISVIPDSWEGEIMRSGYTDRDTIWFAPTEPLFVIKYVKPGVTFTAFGGEIKNPQLVLNFFDISETQEMVDLVISQKDYPWCITWYFGETNRYIILTSPCFVNHGNLGEVYQELDDLYSSLKGVIQVVDHFSPEYIWQAFW